MEEYEEEGETKAMIKFKGRKCEKEVRKGEKGTKRGGRVIKGLKRWVSGVPDGKGGEKMGLRKRE